MIWFGGDYNPEQWDPAVWAEDDTLMREARVTAATVGVFSWSRLEPAEGRYEFAWLDATLDRLHAAGVRVVLATPTASPPPWFTSRHPDAMPVTRDGVRLTHGSRDTYCAAAPAYRQAAARIAEALASRYAGHPALAMWHVHNEYGTVCWCDHAAAAFRNWLRRRYGGTDALNAAWGTDFWSQRYSSWEEVLPPRATQYLANPSQLLDYRRFWSDELLAAFTEQRDAIKRHTPGIPVTTNFMLPDYQVLDLWAWSREVDVVAVDHYLASPGPAGHADIAFAADRARSLKGGPWLLMEQAASLVFPDGLMKHRPPGRMLRDSVGYLARGADGVLFFQWRASRYGAEMFHSALVPHAGRDSRIFAEATQLGAAVERLAEIEGSLVSADTAILWDADSWWALESAGERVLPSGHLRYLDALRAEHAALWRAGIVCDFARPETDLSAYRLVLLPASYLLSDKAADALREYARGGGHLVVSFFSGIVDDRHHVRTGGYPGALRDILGVTVTEFHPLAPGEAIKLRGAPGHSGIADGLSHGTIWSERLRPDGADVIATYAGGALAGEPAITRNSFGGGLAWYVSTRLERPAHEKLLKSAAAAAGAGPAMPDMPPGVEVVRRHGAAGQERRHQWLFALNHSGGAVTLRAAGVELLTGRAVRGRLRLGPGEVVVIREDREADPDAS